MPPVTIQNYPVMFGFPDTQPKSFAGVNAGLAVYLTKKYGARKLLVGSNWTVLQMGVRFRHKLKAPPWTGPFTLAGKRVGFGLCSGTANPYRSASTTHFVGVSTGIGTWTRVAAGNWWTTGYRVFRQVTATETLIDSGSIGTLRVSGADDLCSAWYCRFEKLSSTSMAFDLYVPNGNNSPGEDDFVAQLRSEDWRNSLNNHAGYQQFASTGTVNEAAGALDTINIFSDILDNEARQLGSVEFLSVRAAIIS